MGELADRTILVVDDDRFIRETLRLVLRAIDHFVIAEADDGDAALVQTDIVKPDVVLCDIAMPHMGGLQFVAQLRRHPEPRMRHTPVVILTSRGEAAVVLGAARLQVSGFLVKPVSPKALGVCLRRILLRGPATGAARPAAPVPL